MVQVSDGYDTFCNIREGDISLDLEKAGDISWTGKKQKQNQKLSEVMEDGLEENLNAPVQLGGLVLLRTWNSQLWPALTLNKSFTPDLQFFVL